MLVCREVGGVENRRHAIRQQPDAKVVLIRLAYQES